MSKTIWNIDDADFITYVNESKSYSDLMRKCGYTNVGNNSTVKKRIELLKLSTIHFINSKFIPINKKNSKVSNNDYFTINNKHNNRDTKKRLINDFNWEYKCKICGISEWNNKPLSLELDHINGVNDDNRIDNLQFLCLNCHSQTSTFRTKNKVPVEIKLRNCEDCGNIICKTNKSGYCNKCSWKYKTTDLSTNQYPSLEELNNDMKELKTYVAVGKKYNVTDNTIKNWIKKYINNKLSYQISHKVKFDRVLIELKKK